jgi:hypothetical protein
MLLPASAALAAPGVTVDHFVITQSVSRTGVGSSFGVVGPNAAIMGGYRKVVAEVTQGTGTLATDANVSKLHQFSQSLGSNAWGKTTITYDGTSTNMLNPIGLQTGGVGIDFTSAGTNNALVVQLTRDDLPASMTVTVYTSVNSCSSRTLNLVSVYTTDAPVVLTFRYIDFTTGVGCASQANFADVGAVVLLLDASGPNSESADISFELFETAALDYGDLPNGYRTNYNVDVAITGAAHVETQTPLRLGTQFDTETGSSSAGNTALNDDNTGSPDDEDGVQRLNTPKWQAGSTGALQVQVSGGDGCLMGWIDWDESGAFDAPAETILNNQEVTPGGSPYTFNINIPETAAISSGIFYARFRLYPRDEDATCSSVKSSNRPAYSGEVEDYRWTFGPNAVTLSGMTASSAATPLALPLGIVTFLGVLVGGIVLARRPV